MSTDTAKRLGFGNVIVGSFCLPLVMYDGNSYLRYDSRARSGDYFETIATELENISEQTKDMTMLMKLEEIIEELAYIQQHYELKRKLPKAARRQSD